MEYIPFNFENFICKQNSKLQKAYIWNRLNTYDTFNVVSFWNFFNSKNFTNLLDIYMVMQIVARLLN